MKKTLIVTAIVLAIPVVALAAPAPKVFVCKYVGTPGTDERLQTGQNPINVSSNAIKDYKGVGSYFNDAQGRSYVLAEDNGQPEPNVSQCPIMVTPPPVVNPNPPVVTTSGTNQTLPATTEKPIDYTNFAGK